MSTPVSPSHLGYPTEVLVNFTSRLDLRSIGRVSVTDKALNQAVNEGPLMFVRIKAKLAHGPLPQYAGAIQERLEALALAYVSRATLRCNLPEFQKKANPGWRTAAQIAINDEPLRVLENIGATFAELIEEGPQGELRLRQAVRTAMDPELWQYDYNAAIDAYAALLRAMGQAIFQRKNSKGLLKFISEAILDLKTFVVRYPPSHVAVVDKAKYALLIGELLRTYSRAAQWNIKKTELEFKRPFTLAQCLSDSEWEKIFALATSRRKDAASYLDLTNLEGNANSAKDSKAKRGEKIESGVQARQRTVESMPVRDALRAISGDFGDTLNDLNADSCAWLGRLLERASHADVWEHNTSAAMDAHADLLRTLGQSFRLQLKRNKKGVRLFTRTLLRENMEAFIVPLAEQRKSLDKTRLQCLAGELLRTHELGSSSSEKKMNWYFFQRWWVDLGLLSPEQWTDILQRATSRLNESLCYRDLVAQPSQPVKEKNRRHSASVRRPETEKGAQDKEAQRTHQRSASMSSAAPMHRTTESETNAQNTDKEADEVEEELREDDVTGNRYDKQKCTVS